jgi:hypothetical protein
VRAVLRSPRLIRPRRAAYLVTIGLGWTGYGTGIVVDPRYGTARGLVSITRYVPLNVLGWLWVAAGVLAVVAGLTLRCPRWQAAGFTALAVPATLWGAAFTSAWARGGYPSASGSAAAWVAMALGIYWVSGMVDPPARKRAIE